MILKYRSLAFLSFYLLIYAKKKYIIYKLSGSFFDSSGTEPNY